jgi:hypothetical protein
MVIGGVSNVPQSFEANVGLVLRTYPLFLQPPVRLFTQFRASAKEGSRESESLCSGSEINSSLPRIAFSRYLCGVDNSTRFKTLQQMSQCVPIPTLTGRKICKQFKL